MSPTSTTTRRRVLPVGPRLAERAQAQRSARRRARLRSLSIVALALVPVLLLAWVLLSSPLLSVRTVEVVGATRLTPDAVLSVAAVQRDTPLARLDTVAVHDRVAALGPVERVRVVRAWPRTVRLVVTERVPVATARSGDGQWVLVDDAGVRFSPTPDQAPGLPELQVAPEQPPGPAVEVLAELPATLRDQVATVQLPSPASVLLLLRDGRSVVWGPPGQVGRKAAVVAALLPRPGKTIDVTSPDVAVVR